jgi:integrase
VNRAITETTRQTLGLAVNPHAFRMAAAIIAALLGRGEPHLASALQHTDPRATEARHNRATSLQVALEYRTLVRDLGR